MSSWKDWTKVLNRKTMGPSNSQGDQFDLSSLMTTTTSAGTSTTLGVNGNIYHTPHMMSPGSTISYTTFFPASSELTGLVINFKTLKKMVAKTKKVKGTSPTFILNDCTIYGCPQDNVVPIVEGVNFMSDCKFLSQKTI